MGKADIKINTEPRWIGGAFNIKTRVIPARKTNPFWNSKNAAPSECIVVKVRPHQS